LAVICSPLLEVSNRAMMTRRIIVYLKAGYLLQIISCLEILVFLSLLCYPLVRSWITSQYSFAKLAALSPAIVLPLFAQVDARSRYQNYKLIKDNLSIYGFQKRLLKPFVTSRCQRDAIKAAADELGMLDVCNEYFKSSGYKWYHLLPDIVFSKPSILLSKKFWLTTLFEKTYHSKIGVEKDNLRPSLN